MMNMMMIANMDEHLVTSSSELIIKEITRGNYFLPSYVDLLKEEIDGYLKLRNTSEITWPSHWFMERSNKNYLITMR